MSVICRPYIPEPLFGPDYEKLRRFLLSLDDVNYPFGRWDWMISHSHLQAECLAKIGIWEDNGKIVGLATYDTMLDGKCFFPTKPSYGYLRREMIRHAEKNLSKDGRASLLICDGDMEFQDIAADMQYMPTQDKDCDAIYPIINDRIHYTLPEGFTITSMAKTFDLYRYGQVLWKGFNHEQNGEGPYSPTAEKLSVFENEFKRPNVNLDLKIAVVAPNGDFVSYCGMWKDPDSDSALVEPVATDPAYRKMGLGKAAVLEAVKRCGALGAKRAYVGSSQQFYYSIGFRPHATSTWWGPRAK